MLAAYTPEAIPYAVSIWGNDLTLHAKGSPRMASMTLRCLARADALIADTRRDIRLGYLWGFSPERPTLVVPGSRGIDLVEINQHKPYTSNSFGVALPAGVPLIVNPRGSRPGSVRNDVFFQAIPLVLRQKPEAFFVCPSMAGQPEALNWIKQLGIEHHVRLMPMLPQNQLWEIFQNAQVYASPSQHDGTPNSLLEAMASGCFPIAGDIESLREWITPGVNGLLIDPTSPAALAEAIVTALDSPQLRYRAKEINIAIIRQRAEASLIKQSIDAFYRQLA
jgi:glycosyltransferase involved in cell wall biosynthesis